MVQQLSDFRELSMRPEENSAITATRGGRNAMALASRQQQQRKESDLFTGASNRFAIGTLAERTIGYVRLVHLPDNHTAEATSAGVPQGMTACRPAPHAHLGSGQRFEVPQKK